ncbi:hypothetical protein AGABI2DRAFT_227003 [Agaricus bisporus var. bisporus H97]|uniref:hypothetical protein n=1 Tax=Agaricus bisporus var. bisporus (strain H97 / ATCC MYA-4626 / FGSC 10389) TaxID=936046 RepID=UPI00029F734E|nr:hypothetical protein AGABI2DRAFT_227003 [Agaricus bisporus var. bisporus H97]EKV43357.1 hypothetical protein AGABI2DRAFT_227003 [Agaricus bisporus var. bisporus H97]
MNATDLLANTLSADARTREDATHKLDAASRENYPEYMIMLTSVLGSEGAPVHVRNAAGLALKNALSARDATRQQEYSNRWLQLPVDTKNKIKQQTLETLASPLQKAGNFASQVVAAIAAVELPNNQWADLIELLLSFVNNQQNTNLKIATLQTIGFICEVIKPEILSLRSNEILTAVIHGARKEEPSSDVQLAAVHALYNSLEFVRENFEREGERNYIMQVVCEATQNQSVQVQVGAFECLVRIMGLYYDKMALYMEQALFGLTVMGMKHNDERVALQAVEFWSTVCEEEVELTVEAQEALDYGEQPEAESRQFAKVALPEIVPVLLQLLTKQDEDADDDEWNVSMAAATCLNLLAMAVQDAIVPAVIPFIEANIKGDDWHLREAAIMTFGSILDGPDPGVLTPLVNQALPLLISMMNDQNLHVKDTTAWTLGRISDLLVTTIKTDVHLHPLVSALVSGLTDSPRIATNCSWALKNLAEQLGGSFYDEDGNESPSGPLSPYYEGVIAALLRVTERYEQIVGIDDRNNWNDLISNLCNVVMSVIRKLEANIQPRADRIMTINIGLLAAASKTTTIVEDTFLVIGALASALDTAFSPYIDHILTYLYPALKAHEDTQLCTTAVGLVGDISRALSEQSGKYAGHFMTVLLENLQSEVLNRNVKVSILSCFGDIALAVGPGFEPYFETTMTVLRQAGQVEPNPLDYDLVDYVATLREGILEAYTGITTGFKKTDKAHLLLQHVPSILDLIQRCLKDDDRTDATMRLSYGLIGDLADSFPRGEIKHLLLGQWIVGELRTKYKMPGETKKTLRWAREMVKVATQ